MLIVCTRESNSLEAAWKKTTTWGRTNILEPHLDQKAADSQLRRYLSELKPHEPLCLFAYGYDTTIGDPRTMDNAWAWTARDIANLLLSAGTVGHWAVPDQSEDSSSVLFQLINPIGSRFTTLLAHAVLDARTSNFGLSCYGYIEKLDPDMALPGPTQLKYKVLPKNMTSLVIARI